MPPCPEITPPSPIASPMPRKAPDPRKRDAWVLMKPRLLQSTLRLALFALFKASAEAAEYISQGLICSILVLGAPYAVADSFLSSAGSLGLPCCTHLFRARFEEAPGFGIRALGSSRAAPTQCSWLRGRRRLVASAAPPEAVGETLQRGGETRAGKSLYRADKISSIPRPKN